MVCHFCTSAFHQRRFSGACGKLGSTWTRAPSAQTEAPERPDKVNIFAHRCTWKPRKAFSIHAFQVFGLYFQGNPPAEFSRDRRINGVEKETLNVMQKHSGVCIINSTQLKKVSRLSIFRSLSYDTELPVTKHQSLRTKNWGHLMSLLQFSLMVLSSQILH